MSPNLQLFTGYGIIAICAIGGIYGGFLALQGHTRKSELKRQVATVPPKEQQYLVPELTLKLFQMPTKAVSPYKLPLVEYKFVIDSKNKKAVQITDCRIQFFFKHPIYSLVREPLMYGGKGMTVSGVKIYSKDKKGKLQSYEEKPSENPLTDSFSLEIEETKINDTVVKTNIAMFTCAKWPKEVAFAGSIIVDSSKQQSIIKLPQKLGTYEGTYFYQIDNKSYKGEIKADIPDIKK